MARRPRLLAPGLLYHVIVRDNQQQKTFVCDQDYRAYLECLASYRRKHNVTVPAYCLMLSDPGWSKLAAQRATGPTGDSKPTGQTGAQG